MKRRISLALCDTARRLLPATRRPWGDAMIAELLEVETDRAAFEFAAGCMFAALRERIGDVETRYSAGLWGIAAITALYALVQLACAAAGIGAVLGEPDGMHDALVRQGASRAVMASYETARPVVVGCFLGLGIAQMAAAWWLSRAQFGRFFVAACVALLLAAIAVAIQLSVVWSLEGVPSEFHALLVQAIVLPALLAWHHRRQQALTGERP